MDSIVDALDNAYHEFVDAVAGTLEAQEASGGQASVATNRALESLVQRWELFRVACDEAQEFLESFGLRMASECLVDEATASSLTPGLSPINAVRLERMSKVVRWLVLELQQATGSSHQPFDARFHEDSAQ